MTGPARGVTFLITDLDRGGAERQVVRIARALARRGWAVDVVTLRPRGELAAELESAGMRVRELSRPGETTWLIVPRLFRLLRQERPEILATFMYHANVLGRVCGRLTRVPTIVSSIRNTDFGGIFREWMERFTARLDHCTTTNSTLVAEALVSRGIVRQDRIRVIPNGVRPGDFQEGGEGRRLLRSDADLQEEDFLWLTVGHLHPQKDHVTLLEAFAQLMARWPDARLWVVGEGPELETLRRLRERRQITDAVEFMGLRTDIPQLLAACDGFVLSSAWEGSPNAVLEALDARRPVVATAVGGVPELVEDGVTGFLAAPGDAAELSRCMSQVMSIPRNERRKMGEAARQLLERKFDLERVVDQWETVFTES